jgi:hypothetical protein
MTKKTLPVADGEGFGIRSRAVSGSGVSEA